MGSIVDAPAAADAAFGGDATQHEAELGAFVDAVLARGGKDAAGIAVARREVERALGAMGVVQAAAVIGQFDGINKLADISGCQMDTVKARGGRGAIGGEMGGWDGRAGIARGQCGALAPSSTALCLKVQFLAVCWVANRPPAITPHHGFCLVNFLMRALSRHPQAGRSPKLMSFVTETLAYTAPPERPAARL